MKHLYFCRHGESELNVQLIYAGHTDTPLTDRGREQAKQAGASARDMHFDVIISSPLIRALETAQIIAGEIQYPADKIIIEKLFIEQAYGTLAGQPFSVLPDPNIYSGIETEAELYKRAQAALDYLNTLGVDSILVVSHGSFGFALRRVIQPDAIFNEAPNAQIIQLL